ncbi:hypothetical protein EKH57_08935 [Halorubrum sp. BOL3-1]|uniref:hypothetical protein n=1 Tax=Halorubrum sp. BOL3-1 TaxID=2497325 RepID=UPI001004FCD5|nr:hypothetical protein [Halorubrum sp. BOL3-1]QAU12840.1 hypothetical protein EKH57_08935 [Halorubrum sp. BOL3-1]
MEPICVAVVHEREDLGLPSHDGELRYRVAQRRAEVVREAAKPEYPPRFRTALTNASDRRVRFGEGHAAHFEYVSDDSGALVFLPSDIVAPVEPDCRRLADAIGVTEEYRTVESAAGELSERVVNLYATTADTDDTCLPVGEHRFETTVSVGGGNAEPEASAE